MDRLERFLRIIVIIMLAVMVVTVISQIFYRYFLGNPITWSEEVTRYLFIYVTFLGAAIGIRKKIHVTIDIVADLLKGAPKKILEKVVEFIMMIFLAVIVYLGTELAISTLGQKSPALGIPIGLAYLAIPIGALLAIIFLIEKMMVSRRGEQR